MPVILTRKFLAASLALLLASSAVPVLAHDSGPTLDLGSTDPSQSVQVTLVLKVHQPQALENFIYQTITPGSPQFHQFLSTQQFASRYGASNQEIAQVKAFLTKNGIQSTKVFANHLAITATGTVGQFEQAFQVSVHDYQDQHGHRFHRPSHRPQLPTALRDTLVVATGLSSEPQYHSHHQHAAQAPAAGSTASLQSLVKTQTASGSGGNSTASGVPGEFTVGDVANFYDINPLYQSGITGKGSTVAIVTLAGFYPADAEQYWSSIGLKTKANRITQIHVDGGGEISSEAGSGETSIDVEQSGGLAPQADVLVYDSPNTDGGFLDIFYQAVSDNVADSISCSWGESELFYFNSALSDNTDLTAELQAFHQVFLDGAAQGISMFAAAGDGGAYDFTNDITHPEQYSAPLNVDSPASDPFMTAAGGTTVPFTYSFRGGPKASITQESVWGWDYIQNYFTQNGLGDAGAFPGGGGGGVSVYWPVPLYQLFTPGIRNSEPNQALVDLTPNENIDGSTQTTPLTLVNLPAHFHGRNVPDLSLNADPESGYIFVSTADGGLIDFEGGTSFVAPQFNGITALLRQNSGHRIGFWNPQVYAMQSVFGYGKRSAFNDVAAGDNWFYYGKPGYDPGAGLGTLDVANFAKLLKSGAFSY